MNHLSDEPVATTSSTDVAVPEEDILGLEDFDRDDQSIPRLNIVQDEAEFEDSLTGIRYPELDVILLGLVKQRVLWPPEMGDSPSDPLCKSIDAKIGRPGDDFPWEASKFDKAEHAGGELSCGACPLKDWDSHPTRNSPWCTEQFVIPVLMPVGEKVMPALVTFQRSSIKPVKQYISGFASRQEPLFTTRTTITLTARKRGNVEFSVPKLRRGEETDAAMHDQLADQYRSIRTFLTTPRVEDEPTTSEEVKTEPAGPDATSDGPEPSAASGDDDLF